jgi:methanol---5-hydroxybenzimidazolylcobamide Co-methyltransferase
MKEYSDLAIHHLDDFVYGFCPNPIQLRNGMVIGGGTVYPELNFTLPDMLISEETLQQVDEQYRQMISGACQRAVELHVPGLVVEFELLPDQTRNPEWGARVVRILKEVLAETAQKNGLFVGLRITPNDIREFARPPMLRSGEYLDQMLLCFEKSAVAGADFFSIESTGGKEVHDEAILNGDLELSAFSLGILASRDMAFLWDQIVAISQAYGVVPAGDSACGFANTAMVLADQRFIPRVWAAIIRVMTVARSLVAFEHGALGPSKDCAYEGPYLKAITGCPIALEGSEAAVAHLSPIGNIARAVPDLWSNESVNNVKLLGGMAPTVCLEQLVYAVRLMNTAAGSPGGARTLRNWYSASDASLDPQAYVLRPDVVLDLAAEIVAQPSAYLRTRTAAQRTCERLRQAGQTGSLSFSKIESRWLDRLSRQAELLPENEDELIAAVIPRLDPARVRLDEYGFAI